MILPPWITTLVDYLHVVAQLHIAHLVPLASFTYSVNGKLCILSATYQSKCMYQGRTLSSLAFRFDKDKTRKGSFLENHLYKYW
jgi:hypothetical protein